MPPLAAARVRRHAAFILLHRLLLFTKLVAVLAYAGGAIASLIAERPSERRSAVHGVASPALLVVWVTGYALSERLGIGLAELWVLGGLGGSFVSLSALVVSLHVQRRGWAGGAALALLALVLWLMIDRPTWSGEP